MAIELGPPMSESSSRISKFYDPTDSKYKFHQTRIENWLTIGLELGSPDWAFTAYSHNHYTMFDLHYDGDYDFMYPSSKSCNNPGELSLPFNCASTLKIHTQRSQYKDGQNI